MTLYWSCIQRHYMIQQCKTAVIRLTSVHRRVKNGGVNCKRGIHNFRGKNWKQKTAFEASERRLVLEFTFLEKSYLSWCICHGQILAFLTSQHAMLQLIYGSTGLFSVLCVGWDSLPKTWGFLVITFCVCVRWSVESCKGQLRSAADSDNVGK